MRTFLLILGTVWLGTAVLLVLGLLRVARRQMPSPPACEGEDSPASPRPQSKRSDKTPALAD